MTCRITNTQGRQVSDLPEAQSRVKIEFHGESATCLFDGNARDLVQFFPPENDQEPCKTFSEFLWGRNLSFSHLRQPSETDQEGTYRLYGSGGQEDTLRIIADCADLRRLHDLIAGWPDLGPAPGPTLPDHERIRTDCTEDGWVVLDDPSSSGSESGVRGPVASETPENLATLPRQPYPGPKFEAHPQGRVVKTGTRDTLEAYTGGVAIFKNSRVENATVENGGFMYAEGSDIKNVFVGSGSVSVIATTDEKLYDLVAAMRI